MERKKAFIFGTTALCAAALVWFAFGWGEKRIVGEVLPAGIPVEGPATSSVTIVEFLDFQCSACAVFHVQVMSRIREEYKGRIRYAQRQFVMPEIHEYAKGAALAAVCASRQDKYFEYADALIVNQNRLKREDLMRYAEALGLDLPSFDSCLDDLSIADFVVSERKAGEAFGINGTPWLFINREVIEGTPNYEQLKKLIDDRLKQ